MKKPLDTRLCLGIAAGFFCPVLLTFAQNPSPAPRTTGLPGVTVEEVIVTGSNIPTSEEVGPNPVFNLNRELINRSGQGTSAEQFLKIQPVMNASGIPVSNNAGGSGGGPAGTASISLRGFDPGATLVLIDGRRVTPFPGNASSGAAFIDLLTLPITAVQSIEILKDGASTTYGADAVAGVINFKFYKEYRGAQLNLYYGDTLDKDAGLCSGDILFGTGDDKVSIVGDIFFYHHNSMLERDRGNSQRVRLLSSSSSPYNLQVSSDVAAAAGAPREPIPTVDGKEFVTPPNGTNGLAPASTYILGPEFNVAAPRLHQQAGQLRYFLGSRPEGPYGSALCSRALTSTHSRVPFRNRNAGVATPHSTIRSVTISSSFTVTSIMPT